MSPKPLFSHSTRVNRHYEDDNNFTFITDDVQEPSREHSRVQSIHLDNAPVSEVPGFCQRLVLLVTGKRINNLNHLFTVTDRERVKQQDNARPRKRKKKHSL